MSLTKDNLLSEQEMKKAVRREKRRRMIRTMFSRRLVVVGAIGFAFFALLAIFAPLITKYDPAVMDAKAILAGPSSAHWLGTDNYGRDLFTRLVYGARVSIVIGVVAVSIAAAVGITLGMLAAYFGGVVDVVVMRGMEALHSIPSVMFSLAMIMIIGNSMFDMAVLLAITTVPTYVRMTRAMTLKVRSSDYVKAAKMAGAPSYRILLRHILPNIMSPNIVQMVGNVGSTILMEAGLSFLGVGISIPTPSWGTMVSDGKAYLLTNPMMSIVPGLCVALLVICLNLLGDGVRDAMDPRLRGEN